MMPAPTGDSAQRAGEQAFLHCTRELRKLSDTHPEWFDWFERSDPDVCPTEELMRLMAEAPNELALGFLAGKLSLRQAIASITGRPLL